VKTLTLKVTCLDSFWY